MKFYFLILPIALLVAYSQIIVKWRSGSILQPVTQSVIQKLINFLCDPVIISAYFSALIASFAWLYVITKLPLAVAFPIYIGFTFALVMLGGVIFLAEALTATKIIAVILIFSGIILGVSADA
jgi:multidrug transporter EmrE-like cation transporter